MGLSDKVKAIIKQMENNSITNVDLNFNNIGDEGAKAIAEALKGNQSVTNIHLSSNKIGVEGAKAIAEALKVNQSVTNIILNRNEIGDEGAKTIVEALKVNQAITDISLWRNQIGDEGAKAIVEALKVNQTVTNIDLERNSISQSLLNDISRSLQRNKNRPSQAQQSKPNVKPKSPSPPQPSAKKQDQIQPLLGNTQPLPASPSPANFKPTVVPGTPPVNHRDVHHRLASLALQPSVDITKLTLDRNDKLGSGGFARVHGGTYHNLPVAVKVIHGGVDFDEAMDLELENLRLLSKKDHGNVVLFVGFVPQIGSEPSKLIMEKCTGGTAAQFVSENQRLQFNNERFKRLAMDVVQGLLFIHSLNIIHSDLKPANILLDSDGAAKIGDFGVSKAMRTTQVHASRLHGLTPEYAPLEARQSFFYRNGNKIELKYTTKIDIWSLGCVLYAVTLGQAPWYHLSNVETNVEAKRNDIVEEMKQEHTPQLDRERHGGKFGLLLKQCWMFEPNERPSAAQLIHAIQQLGDVDGAASPVPSSSKQTEAPSSEDRSVPVVANASSPETTSATATIRTDKLGAARSGLPQDVDDWSVDEVVQFLKKLRVSEEALAVIEKEKIAGEALLDPDLEDKQEWQNMGVTARGDLSIITKVVRSLQQQQ